MEVICVPPLASGRPKTLDSTGENGGMNGEPQRGVIIYGYGVDAVVEALLALDPRYVMVDHMTPEPGQVAVLRREDGAQADAARDTMPDFAWLVVELYRQDVEAARARNPLLLLNGSRVDPGTAARAIDQHDLTTWYEIINPVRVTTVDSQPMADDYSNIKVTTPDGHRIIAHAVRNGAEAMDCVPAAAARVLPSHDLWALQPRQPMIDRCPACTLRHE